MVDLRWQAHAACAGTGVEAWFAEDNSKSREDKATMRRLCHSCAVVQDCLDHALRYEASGYWAATTPSDRKRLRSKLRVSFVGVPTGE